MISTGLPVSRLSLSPRVTIARAIAQRSTVLRKGLQLGHRAQTLPTIYETEGRFRANVRLGHLSLLSDDADLARKCPNSRMKRSELL